MKRNLLFKSQLLHLSIVSTQCYVKRPYSTQGYAKTVHCVHCFHRAEEQRQIVERLKVIFVMPANIAFPGGEVRHSDQILVEPGEIGNLVRLHLADMAFAAWNHTG